jgi:hypothetical protein
MVVKDLINRLHDEDMRTVRAAVTALDKVMTAFALRCLVWFVCGRGSDVEGFAVDDCGYA